MVDPAELLAYLNVYDVLSIYRHESTMNVTGVVAPCFAWSFSSLRVYSPSRRPHLSLRNCRTSKCRSIKDDGLPWVGLATYSFIAGAALGPICDYQHSSHDVLHYTDPTITAPIETCWWVPLLFGVAGFLLGSGHPVLDRFMSTESRILGLRQQPVTGYAPSWSQVFLCIALFYTQYWVSGVIDASDMSAGVLPDVVLAVTALSLWYSFDRTAQGLIWAVLTALGGPLLEVLLINGLHLYEYSHPDVYGIPSWICWVYFAGAPANGLLGRKIFNSLQQTERNT